MKRFLVCLAALALAPACGVAKDDVAATVNGRDVLSSDLSSFAATPFVKEQANSAGGLTTNLPGSIGGATLRLALPFKIQTLIFEDAVRARSGKVTSEDLDSAEQTLASNETNAQSGQAKPIDAKARKVLKRYVAAQAALARLLAESDPAGNPATPEKIAAVFDANPAQYDNLSCVEGFAVPTPLAAQAQAAVDGGAGTAEILGNAELQAQGLSQSGAPECVFPAVVTNSNIAPIVFGGAVGEWATVDVDDGNGGTVTVFLRPTSRSAATATTPEVAAAIAQQLQQDAQQANQSKVGDEFTKIFEAADVFVDPRIGTWNPEDQAQLILPPPVPQVKALDVPTVPAAPGVAPQ